MEAGEREVSDDELETLLDAIGTTEAAEFADILRRQWEVLPRPALDHPDQELLWQAEEVAASLGALVDKPETRQAFGRRLNEYVDEIRHLAGWLQRRQHQLAFIGSIGVGKSTAICRATGLEVEGAGAAGACPRDRQRASHALRCASADGPGLRDHR